MRGMLFLPFRPCWDTIPHGSPEPLTCCSISSALMRAAEILPKKRDCPTPQSFCREAILDLLETGVCSLVYSFEYCPRAEFHARKTDDGREILDSRHETQRQEVQDYPP